MNQTFDIKRFSRYLAYTAGITGLRQLYGLGVGLGAIFVACMWPVVSEFLSGGLTTYTGDIHGDPFLDMEVSVFSISFFLIMVVTSSGMFRDFSGKTGRLDALMLPASQLEKFLARWIFAVPVTAAVLLIGFELIDLVRYAICRALFPDVGFSLIGLGLDYYNTDVLEVYYGVLIFLISVYALGAIVWPKRALVKTTAAGFLVSTLAGWLALALSEMFLKQGYHYGLEMDYIDGPVMVLALGVLAAMVNYTIAYFRLREIELVQRW